MTSVALFSLSLAASLASGVLLLPILSDLVTCLRSRTMKRPSARLLESPARFVFLVPAHNEELLIAATVRSLLRMQYPRELFSVIVIADNCADATAAIARGAGAQVLERTNLNDRGKPRAIHWALSRLDLSEYDALTVVDADSVVDPHFAAALAIAGPVREFAFQPYNDVSNRTDTGLTRMAAVFSAARVRMDALKQRAGLNVPLSNGLTLGTALLARVGGWRAFSLCEDWELYAILTSENERVKSVPRARIFAQEARSLRQSSSQRRRWAAGKIAVLRSYGRLVLQSKALPAQKLDALAELLSPGPAVHLGVVACLAGALLILGAPGAAIVSAALMFSLARHALYTTAAILADETPGRAALAFLTLPMYTVWRIGVQLRAVSMFVTGSARWVRTSRHPQPQDGSSTPTTNQVDASVAADQRSW